jgi:LmbE family N-acetylglucosaminyl deacetylase
MLRLRFDNRDKAFKTVLCLGSHCDDIEIGCGGTILKLLEEDPDLDFHWIVLSSDETRAKEATASANLFLERAKTRNIVLREFRNSFFPFMGAEIKEYFETVKRDICPHLIFTHYRGDLHQDHRLISDLTWNTFRNHLILEYEIPKYDGDLGSPNLFVHLEKSTCERKVKWIVDSFKTQMEKDWFSEETFFSMLRLRGIESSAPSGYAEGFYCRKCVL